MISYAQNFEDVILERLFKENKSGFYVDVGARDPMRHSATAHFYSRGWRGVNIEASAARAKQFDSERPRDINLCVGVGRIAGEFVFYECLEENSFFIRDPLVATTLRKRGLTVIERKIAVTTLNEILSNHCPQTVDFLKIGIGRRQSKILEGIDLARHRPRVILVDVTRPATPPFAPDDVEEVGTWNEWEPQILSERYHFVHFNGVNRFYLRSEDSRLAQRLALPPGIYDEIKFPLDHVQRAESELFDRDRRAVTGEGQTCTNELTARVEVIEQARRALAMKVDALSAERDRMASERAALRAGLEATIADRERMTADCDDKLESAAVLPEWEKIENNHIARHSHIGQSPVWHEDLRRKIARKDEVIATISNELVGYRSAAGGALDIAYRYRRVPGRRFAGGRYIGSPRADGAGRRVAIDVMAIQFGISGGVEVYMRTLIRAVLSLKTTGIVIVCLDVQLAKLRAMFSDQVGYYIFKSKMAMKVAGLVQGLFRRSKVVETTDRVAASFSRLREEINADIIHCPVQSFSLFDFNIPAILHLHDLQHVHFPDNFSQGDIDARNYYYGLSAELSSKIVATSQFVREDIIAKMGVPAEKVACIPATWDPAVEAGLTRFSVEDARKIYRLPVCFGLFPAQFWPHKNHVRLVEALGIVRQTLPNLDFKLVLTGNRGHAGWAKVAETMDRLGVAESVSCLNYVPVEHLAALYRSATFCVMPSTFEASSYPVIEAQLLGCPAMCSNVTSLPELMAGGAGLLFDPFDSRDIAAKMIEWLRHPEDAKSSALRAREKVRREHGLSNYAGAIEALYQRLAPC